MREARQRLSQLLKAAQAGEDVVIANGSEPATRLVPIRGSGSGAQGSSNARDIIDWLESHPLPRYARRSAKAIDMDIKMTRQSWHLSTSISGFP